MKARGRARGPKKRRSARRRAVGRAGSWPVALTEAESARRHVAQAVAALDRLGPELAGLRAAADATARLDVARELLAGPDGGALGLLVRLVQRDRTAAAVLERLTAALALEAVHAPNDRVSVTEANRGDYQWLGGSGLAGLGECVVVRPGWRMADRPMARPVVARPPAPQALSDPPAPTPEAAPPPAARLPPARSG